MPLPYCAEPPLPLAVIFADDIAIIDAIFHAIAYAIIITITLFAIDITLR